MKLRVVSMMLFLALASIFAVAPYGAAAAPKATNATAVLTDANGVVLGTVTNLTATFDRAANAINVSGTFTQAGQTVGQVFTSVIGLANFTQAACDILTLDLGPLDLNILGLQVDLSRVVLEITAQPGPGNLLGNLLCAIAGLLDNGGPLQAVTNLLNNLFRNL